MGLYDYVTARVKDYYGYAQLEKDANDFIAAKGVQPGTGAANALAPRRCKRVAFL